MGQPTTTATDQALKVATTAAMLPAAVTPWFDPGGPFTFAALGAGAVQLEMSFDGGTTAINCSLSTGAANTWTVPVVQAVENVFEPGLLFRLKCTVAGVTSTRMSAR